MQPTAGTSPSAFSSTASSAAIDDSTATENRLYQASLLLEWQLYGELLGRHRLAMARLQDLAEEAAALSEENVLLRAANEDLKRRIVARLLSATRSDQISAGTGSPPAHSTIGFVTGDPVAFHSSTSAVQIADRRRRNVDRSCLPKSISVRSTGYMKISNLNSHHRNSDDNLISGLNPSTMENKTVNMNRTTLYMQKEEEVGLRGIEVDAYNQGMYKTELCNKWQESGVCPYRDHCQFAHGLSELRPVLRHPRYKTEVCRMVLGGVPCPYGHRCHFRHTLPARPEDS